MMPNQGAMLQSRANNSINLLRTTARGEAGPKLVSVRTGGSSKLKVQMKLQIPSPKPLDSRGVLELGAWPLGFLLNFELSYGHRANVRSILRWRRWVNAPPDFGQHPQHLERVGGRAQPGEEARFSVQPAETRHQVEVLRRGGFGHGQ